MKCDPIKDQPAYKGRELYWLYFCGNGYAPGFEVPLKKGDATPFAELEGHGLVLVRVLGHDHNYAAICLPESATSEAMHTLKSD